MKNKKLIIGILGIFLLLVLIILLFNKNSDKKSDPVNKEKWKTIIGDEIHADLPEYDANEYIVEHFNSEQGNVANKYLFSVPKEETLHYFNNFISEYTGPIIVNYFDSIIIENINQHIKDYVARESSGNFQKVNAKKNDINKNKFALNVKYLSDDNTYMEDLIVVIQDEETELYSYVKYRAMNTLLSEVFKEKVINDFKYEEKKAEYTTCVKKGNQYNCDITINSINKKIQFSVDATKYDKLSETNINNYREAFYYDKENDNVISISPIVTSDLDIDLENIKPFADFKKSNIVINNKKFTKYFLKVDEHYIAYYVFNIDKDLHMMVSVAYTQDKLDTIFKDFINYKVINI